VPTGIADVGGTMGGGKTGGCVIGMVAAI